MRGARFGEGGGWGGGSRTLVFRAYLEGQESWCGKFARFYKTSHQEDIHVLRR